MLILRKKRQHYKQITYIPVRVPPASPLPAAAYVVDGWVWYRIRRCISHYHTPLGRFSMLDISTAVGRVGAKTIGVGTMYVSLEISENDALSSFFVAE